MVEEPLQCIAGLCTYANYKGSYLTLKLANIVNLTFIRYKTPDKVHNICKGAYDHFLESYTQQYV